MVDVRQVGPGAGHRHLRINIHVLRLTTLNHRRRQLGRLPERPRVRAPYDLGVRYRRRHLFKIIKQ